MRLLDIVAVAALVLAVVSPGCTAYLATDAAARAYTNSLAVLDVLLGLAAMNRDEVTSQVVLATEGTTTRLVVAGVRLGAVGVMRLDMGLQIESASESSGTGGALILALGILRVNILAHVLLLHGPLASHDGRGSGMGRELSGDVGGGHGSLDDDRR